MSTELLESCVAELDEMTARRRATAIAAFDALGETDPDLVVAAVKSLGSKERAALWFSHQSPALGNEMPFVLVLEGKRELLLIELNTLEFGNWA